MPEKTNTTAANRRQFARVAPERQQPVRVHINGDGFIEVTNAVDISEGGIRISVKHRFAGCHVDLPASLIVHLPAPISRHFSVRGRIRHVLGDSFGVEFISLNPSDRALVRHYVERLSGVVKPAAGGLFAPLRKLFGMSA
ncbi:PilZ domain-containing protein [Paucimonas lemoignei]|uniref:PilZ domain-containing protein n=1 Tax=Paucimonas lemoignei TaxID=29443 RepID=A0A4R3HPR8_PAULE|nr:PilZ domain-containing protein [Paucimonas lemoignei]TCS33744.1 PilZ domain-containing protein [Paucimonas lemoignei]